MLFSHINTSFREFYLAGLCRLHGWKRYHL
jgi:hypothetical protein